MVVEDRYSYDKEREALEVYRTTDREHPGVAALHRQSDTLLGGVRSSSTSPTHVRSPATTTNRTS